MRIGWPRLVAVLAVAVAVVCVAPAGAFAVGLDGSYGSNGFVQLAPPPPPGFFPAASPQVNAVFSRDGSAYATVSTSTCEPGHDTGSCEERTLLFRYDRSGTVDQAFGDSGAVDVSKMGALLSADVEGRVLLAARTEYGAKVERLLASGRPDPEFGRGGEVRLRNLPNPEFMLPAGRGRILVGASEGLPGAFGMAAAKRMILVRLLPDGRLDRSFGSHGRGNYTLAVPYLDPLITIDRSGSILILGQLCCEGYRPVYRINAKGKLDTRFNAAARGALGEVGGGGGVELTSLVPRPDGGVDVLGVTGDHFANPRNAAGIELRLRPSGRLDRTFGERGIKKLALPITAAGPGVGGGTIAVGEVGEAVTVIRLLADGEPDPAFGGGSGVQIPQLGIHAAVQPLAGGRAGVFGHGFRPCNGPTCINAPYLARFIEASPSRSAGTEGGRS